jgi:hypothetical protein
MRDNFNVHEWRIDQIRKENISEQLDDEKAVQSIASAVSEFADIPNENSYKVQFVKTALGAAYLNEGWNDDIDKVTLMYTNYGDLYKVKIDGKTVNTKDVEDLVGMEIPDNGFDTESINQFIDALKRKGITADSYEMDVD